MDFKKLLEKLIQNNNNKNAKDKKNIANLLILLLVGILVVVTMSLFKTSSTLGTVSTPSKNNKDVGNISSEQQSQADDKSSQDYERLVEEKLKNTLENIDGVGKVEVMISFESGEEQVPAVNINDSTNTAEEKDNQGGTRNTTQKNNGSTVVITNNGDKSEPLIVKTYKPKVSGICVVAEGAENKVTELRISKAVVDLFGISENKVNVYPMKK